ncbi:MAG: hypothetical protein QXD48_01330 [Candidatus Aenigmatarchaeota archaeon]
MADDFIVFLVVGLIILAVLMATFVGIETPKEKDVTYPTKTIESLEGSFIIGPKDISTFKPYDIGYFVADYLSGENIYNLGDRIIKNGLLFGETNVKYHISGNIDDLKILFTVKKTNNYGPLIIKLNGNIIDKSNFNEGEYTISINNEMLTNDIILEIAAESSGIRMWAPTFYELKDIKIIAKSFSQNSFAYNFFLIDEYNTFKEGRLELNLDENIGNIIITMNDHEIFSGPIKNVQSFKFDKSHIRYGENYLRINAKENSSFVGHARMLIYYKTEYESRMEIPFNLNESEYKKLKTGAIVFDIVDIISPGGLSVKIVHENQVMYNQYAIAEERGYLFTFDKNNVKQGTNILIIQTVDNAVFAIKNIGIEI